MQSIIFIEAGDGFGLGHLSRALALKDYLTEVDFSVTIYNRGSFISDECIYLEWLDSNLDDLLKDKPLVIVDSYYTDFRFCNYLVSQSSICVFFDDFNRMIYPKDAIILNPALNAKRLYSNLENEAYIGIEYSLLRDAFRKKELKRIKKNIHKVLVTLGSNDAENNTQKILNILEKELKCELIDVVVGDKHPPLEYGFSTTIHSNLNAIELKKLMLECDIAISGGGVTMVELQSTFTPTIALQVAQNQAYQLRAWRDIGLRVATDVKQIKSLLKTLIKFKDRKKLSNRLEKINIGEKAKNLAKILANKYKDRK